MNDKTTTKEEVITRITCASQVNPLIRRLEKTMAVYKDKLGRRVQVMQAFGTYQPCVKLKRGPLYIGWHVAKVGGNRRDRESVEKAFVAYAERLGLERIDA